MSYSSLIAGLDQVTLIAHADWSKDARKRWLAEAVLSPDGRWEVRELSRVDHPSSLFHSLRSHQRVPGCVLAGFDFPIGLPNEYALKAGISDFLSALPEFGHGKWSQFYLPADQPSQVSLWRPFYPARPGNTRRLFLESGLGLSFDQLFRLCEMRQEIRHAACPLFWTLGGQQVGKAAISGWRDLLSPALLEAKLHLHIWPFSGLLAELCQLGNTVVVESYPAEFYHHLGMSFTLPTRRSKRKHAHRLSFAEHLLAWAIDHSVQLDASTQVLIRQGFGSDLSGEDRFDALVGLYGMINVVLGLHPTGEPLSQPVRQVEGWIFGQAGPG